MRMPSGLPLSPRGQEAVSCESIPLRLVAVMATPWLKSQQHAAWRIGSLIRTNLVNLKGELA